jgi:hypothetical protein
MEILSQYSLYSSLDMKWAPPKYKSEVLSLEPALFVSYWVLHVFLYDCLFHLQLNTFMKIKY